MRLRIISSGTLEEPVEEFVARIANQAQDVIVPDPEIHSDEPGATHYWLMFVNGIKTAYFGTPETFDLWQKEERHADN